MEGTKISFNYQGSIPNAISEAQKQKKLFVVYISSGNEDSVQLEQSTFQDQNVSEVITKCCIFLHLVNGSVEASQFLAIYQQNSTPSISVVGLNGVVLWNHEGYIAAESLKESLEKAWAALQLQQFASILSTVARAPRDPQSLGPTPTPSASGQSSTSSDVVATSNQTSQSSTANQADGSEKLVKLQTSEHCDDNESKVDNIGPRTAEGARTVENEGLTTENATENNILHVDNANVVYDIPAKEGINIHDEEHSVDGEAEVIEESEFLDYQRPAVPTTAEMAPSPELVMESLEEDHATGVSQSTSSFMKTDIYLSIRMPNSSSLQLTLDREDTLSAVKRFVDDNQGGGIPYDLAVPYPRKVFQKEDMDRTLAELGFTSREALILLPRSQFTQTLSRNISDDNAVIASNSSASSYFSYAKRVLSFINPFSYFGGNSTSSSQPAAFNSSEESSSGEYQDSFSAGKVNKETEDSRKGGRKSRPISGNIHTLNHDEDQDPYSDRNVFWNGNSTQFGGNDDRN